MISTDMRNYEYYIYGERDNYGQATLSTETKGLVKMAIYTTSQSVQDNINYQNAQYLGLTHENISDKYVIAYGDKKLKVLYIQPKGKLKQVYMGLM